MRRSQHRLDKIAARLELVGGYIIAYLNLDRIIEIIRTEDEPKPVMMAEFDLTDRQAEAILNMRLRSLRKLEEMELRRERDDLTAEQEELQKLLDSPARQRSRLKRDLTAVILSARGWIRGASGHEPLDKDYKFKDGDGPGFVLHAQTTDKLLIACDNGRFDPLGADKLPSARGFGEPLRTMVDIDSAAQIAAVVVYRPKAQLLLASNAGRGFVAEMDELLAETRKGRGVMGTKPGVQLTVVHEIPPEHDHVAVVGDNRKLVIFSLSEMPVMAKGQGVALQRYRDGGLSDATTLRLEDGLSWKMGGDSGRTRTENDLMLWKVARGAAGRMPPNGFPRDNKF